MVTDNHYRWDFIGLSTDEKPTPATSPKVVDGSTFYCSDNSKLYVYCKDQWYEKTATGGGGTTYTAGDGITIADDTISVDTTTIQPKLTAGSNITIADNVISASGGETGLAKVLTNDDYNANSSNWSDTDPTHFNCIAMWKMPSGIYTFKPSGNNSSVSFRLERNTSKSASSIISQYIVIVSQPHPDNNSSQGQILFFDGINSTYVTGIHNDGQNATVTNINVGVVDNLTSYSISKALSANQGRVLNEKIIATKASGAPTTSTTGFLGKVYIDSSTTDAYICVDDTANNYVWKKITA